MRTITLSGLAEGMLFGLAGVALARQQSGQMLSMPGTDHGNMPTTKQPNAQGNGQASGGPGTRAPAKAASPGTQQRSN